MSDTPTSCLLIYQKVQILEQLPSALLTVMESWRINKLIAVASTACMSVHLLTGWGSEVTSVEAAQKKRKRKRSGWGKGG